MAGSDLIRVFNPTGHARLTEVSLAPRPRSLAGLRPGILDNRKMNARLLMQAALDGMRDRVALGEVTIQTKPSSGPPSRAVVQKLTQDCDFVVVGSSD
jgi:hypothetical protein